MSVDDLCKRLCAPMDDIVEATEHYNSLQHLPREERLQSAFWWRLRLVGEVVCLVEELVSFGAMQTGSS